MTVRVMVPLDFAMLFGDPASEPPWACRDGWNEWDTAGIFHLANGKIYGPEHAKPADPFSLDTVDYHMGRIAWLMNNRAPDPITLFADLLTRPKMLVSDGNHRLAAAILCGDEYILVRVVGVPEFIHEIFSDAGLRTPGMIRVDPEDLNMVMAGDGDEFEHDQFYPEADHFTL